MTFRCDADGKHDGRDLFMGHGYIHSKDAMIGTLANISTMDTVAEMKYTNSNYALEA